MEGRDSGAELAIHLLSDALLRELSVSVSSVAKLASRADVSLSESLKTHSHSHRIPRLRTNWVPPFVVFDVIDDRLNRLAGQAAIKDALRQHGGAFVAPTELHDKAIPHVAFLIRPGCPVSVNPRQHVFVRATSQSTVPHVGVTNAEEPTATAIENVKLRIAQIRLVIGGQPSRGVQSDLVEHAAEVDEPTDFRVTTAQTGYMGHDSRFFRARAEARRKTLCRLEC